MTKKLVSFAMTMLLTLFATNVWAGYDYSYAYSEHYTGSGSQGDRYTSTVAISGSVSGDHTANTLQTSGSNCVLYSDLTETVWEVQAGETLTPSLGYVGEWMHKFVYIDFANDGNFDVHLTGSAPYEIGDNNDLVAWGYIDGYDHTGTSRAGSYNGNPPAFTLPADMAPGDYRIRFKVDWNDPTPYGTSKDFKSGSGMIADVTLRVVAPPAASLFDPNLTYVLQPSTNLAMYAATTIWDNNRYVMSSTAEGFKIVGNDDDGYTIMSAETNKYIGMGNNDWNSGDEATAWNIVAVDGQENTYTITRRDDTGKCLGWDTTTWAIFTNKSDLNWVIKTKTAIDYTVSYTLEDYDEGLGDMFSVQVGEEILTGTKEFTEVNDVVVTATAGDGRMVTLKVNSVKVTSPYTVTDCDHNLTIVATFGPYRSPTATTQVYETLGFFGDDMMDLFAKVDAEGRMFPTDEEFEAIGVSLADLAFVRSHVRPQEILDRATRFNSDTYEKRNLWMNLPIGIGKEVGGYPSSNFSDDAYTMWNYTNLFGSWNHSLLHCPGVAADCAHKNGTDIMGGIKFFESWTAGSGASGWVGKCQETSDNGYQSPTSGTKFKYVRPVVNALLYFGKDGINYNFEDTGYANLTDFHSCMYDYAASIGFYNFHVGLYTSSSNITSVNVKSLLGTYNADRPGKGQAYDTFLNYSGSDFQTATNIAKSVAYVEAAKFTTEDVYQGAWIVSMARSWSNLSASDVNKRMGIVLWGEHAQSRFLSYCNGTSAIDFQKNYQLLQDRFMGGGNRNLANRPAQINTSDWSLTSFQGISHYVPERSAIRHNLPFGTFFSTGNGERYNYKGKKTLGSWYNLGQQDVVPTYRWLVYSAGTTNANSGVPYFTHTDAYIGGSSLCMDNTEAVDVILYRTELTVSGNNPVARIARKCLTGAPAGNVSVIVKKNGSDTWIETQFPQISGTEWSADTVALQGVEKGDIINYIGLRTSGDTKNLLIGMLELDDDSKVTPADIVESSVLAEVVEECQKSLSVKLRWNMNQNTGDRAAYGMIYNDECNVSYFEILYKDGENGRVSEVGRTTSWSAYIGNLPMEEETDPYVGVRAYSVDGKTFTDPVWVHITRAQMGSLPESLSANGAYPAIILDNSSDGLTNALTQRYLEKFQIENSDDDFTYVNTIGTPYMADIAAGVLDKNADKTNYIFAEGNVVKVHQGQAATITLTRADFSDGLQYCTARGYADWDCSEGFDGEGDEVVLALGESNAKAQNTDFTRPYSFTLNVPEDAKPGVSRLRFVFSDAWFPHPGAAGAHNKGFSIDFPMEITGTNDHREPAVDTHDEGVSEIPEGISYETAVESVSEGASEFVVVGDELQFQNVDKVWVYTADGRLFRFVDGGVDRLSVEGLSGTTIVRMQCGKVMRSRKIIL